MKNAIVCLGFLFACQYDDVVVDETTESIEVAETTTCENVDLTADATNCGVCGNVCASGLCYSGVCADDRAGHVFVIGHSYRTSNPALDQILGNAVFMREGRTVKVLVYRGTAALDVHAGANNALKRAAGAIRRTMSKTVVTSSVAVGIELPSFDVLVIEAQPQATNQTLASLASEWSLPIDDHLRRGGIVVVMDAPSANDGTSMVLGSTMPMRRETSAPGAVGHVAAHSTIAVGRVPMMFALGDSVGYAPSGHTDAVTSDSGHVVVAHRTFY